MSIVLTDLPMVTEVRPPQRQKASVPMWVTELGMMTDVRPVELKAWLAMKVTELEIVIDVRPAQKAKALSPMEVTELGITVFMHPAIRVLVVLSMMALQLLRLS